jgi:hypothetical protein
MTHRTIALLFAAALTIGCAAPEHTLSLKNNSGAALTYCPVETSPPPPHRVVSTTVVDPTMRFQIDTEGFNPVFWDSVSNLGLAVQIGLELEPPEILVRVFQYQVPPGAEGADPALQPQHIADYYYEVDPATDKVKIVVRVGDVALQLPVEILEN